MFKITAYAPPPSQCFAGRRQRRAGIRKDSRGLVAPARRRSGATAKTVIDYCQPYTPARCRVGHPLDANVGIFAPWAKTADPSGAAAFPDRTLEFSAQAATDIGSGMVVWNTPYAHYQYMGIVYGPNIPIIEDGILMGFFSPPGRPKHPTDRSLTYDTSQNPMAGPYWFERMKADRLNDILETARKAVGGNHE